MDIKVIGAFRFALVDAVNMLARLGCKGYALPSIADLEAVTLRLESPSPFDVVASILADNDYMSHKQMYMMAFGRVLGCEAFTGDVEADGEVYHYWEGLTAKLDDAPGIDKDLYLAQVERLSGLVQENIRGMKASLTATFGGIDTKPEPQQLPDSLNTLTAQVIFGKAIFEGWMRKTSWGFEWLGIDGKKGVGSKGQLAYLCGRVYGYKYGNTFSGNVGDRVPYEALQALFNVSRLDRALRQVYEAKKEQPWRGKIDGLFEDLTSTR